MKKILDFFTPVLACDLGYFITMALLVLKCTLDTFTLDIWICVAPALLQFTLVMLVLYVTRERRKDRQETK